MKRGKIPGGVTIRTEDLIRRSGVVSGRGVELTVAAARKHLGKKGWTVEKRREFLKFMSGVTGVREEVLQGDKKIGGTPREEMGTGSVEQAMLRRIAEQLMYVEECAADRGDFERAFALSEFRAYLEGRITAEALGPAMCHTGVSAGARENRVKEQGA